MVKKIAGKKPVARVDALESRAWALQKEAVVKLTFDPLEAKRACRTGLALLEAKKAALLELCPSFDLEGVRALPELCDRITAAQRQVDQARAGEPLTREQILATAGWRRRLLPLAQTAAEQGQVSTAKLRQIMIGRGTTDALQDIIDLAALLEPLKVTVEPLLGKGALESARRDAQAAIGTLGVVKGDPAAVLAAVELRDRHATLVVRLHDLLRTGVALVSSYREAGVAVPGLGGSGGAVRKPAPAAPASPA